MTTRRARICVPGEPSAVAFARDRVLLQVGAWGVPLDADQCEAVKLVASELVTNAVVHCGGPITIGLTYEPCDGQLLLVVRDGNVEPPRHLPVTVEEEGGRGLALVEAFASRAGWETAGQGKTVWAAFHFPVSAGSEDLERAVTRPYADAETLPPCCPVAGLPGKAAAMHGGASSRFALVAA